jgi:dCMP deaminase
LIDMINRPTHIETLSAVVLTIAKRSTCVRGQNGALIYDNRAVILSTGYNGALADMPHCVHPCDCQMSFLDAAERTYAIGHDAGCSFNKPCKVSMHAEANAIVWAARRGVATEGQNIICTSSPCYKCAQLIIQSGIKEVRYINEYRDKSGLILMLDAGVTVHPVV